MRNLSLFVLVILAFLPVFQAALNADISEKEREELRELNANLLSDSPRKAIPAIKALKEIGTDAALNTLILGFDSRLKEQITVEIIDAIASFDNQKALNILLARYSSQNDVCKRRIINTVRIFAIPCSDDLIISGLADSSLDNQMHAVDVSKKHLTPTVLWMLLKKMQSDESKLRRNIVEIVRTVDASNEEIRILKSGLHDDSIIVVEASLKKLMAMEGITAKEKVELSRHLVGKVKGRVKKQMITAMGALACNASFDVLAELLETKSAASETELILEQLERFQGPKVFGLIEKYLQDKDPRIRTSAVRAMAAQDSEDARQYLIGAIDDKNIKVCAAALEGLKKYRDAKIIHPLLTLGKKRNDKKIRALVIDVMMEMPFESYENHIKLCLEWSDNQTRLSLINILGRKKHTESAAAILGILQTTLINGKFTSPALAKASAKAFRLMGNRSAESGMMYVCTGNITEAKIISIRGLVESQSRRALRVVVGRMKDPKAIVRIEAIRMLGMIPNAEYSSEITGILDDRDKAVRLAAIRVLGKMGDRKVVADLLAPKRFERIMKSKSEFLAVIEAVGRLGGLKASAFLLESAARDDDRIAMAALKALHSEHLRDNKTAGEQLKTIARSHKNEKMRCAAMRALGYVGGTEIFDMLLPLAKRGKYNESAAAIEAISRSGDKRAKQKLLAILEDDSFHGPHESLLAALVRLGDEETAEKLLGFVDKSKQPIRVVFLRIIAPVRSPKVRTFLIGEISGKDIDVAVEAITGIVRWHLDDESAKAILALLQDPDRQPHSRIIRACARLQKKEFADTLIDLVDRMDPGEINAVQRESFQALRYITNNDLGNNAEKWSKWWKDSRDKPLDEIILEGFKNNDFHVTSKNNADSLFQCVQALSSEHHYIRLSALRRLAAAAGEEFEFVDERRWNDSIVEKWYRWFIANKTKLAAS